VTTVAGPDIEPLHHRMPVILPADRWEPWLDPSVSDVDLLGSFLTPGAPGTLERYRVPELVNSVRNDSPELVAPVPDDADGRGQDARVEDGRDRDDGRDVAVATAAQGTLWG
jgi:hypothetical protein